MTENKRRRAIAYACAISAATLWGVGGPVAKYLFNHGVTALALTQIRQSLSFLFLLAFFMATRPGLARIGPRDVPYLAVMGIGGLAMVQFSYYSAISRIQVAAAILLEYMAPIFILMYSASFMKERVTFSKASSLLLAVAGCALVAGVYKVDFLKLNIAGVVWGLASALFFSFYTLYGQAGLKKYNAMTLFAYASGFGSLLWWVLNPPRAFFAVKYSGLTWLAFVYLALFGTTLPFVLYFESLKRMEASRASITSTLEPVVAGVVAYFFIGETMEFPQILGGLLVLAGIVLLQRTPSPPMPHVE
ncbi:MAG: EamA family transporter [Candidatus Lindowbacteria bacterium]|nr:EamA family transporter [Candidatus Lindowbacteria bacterium]